MLKSCLFIPLIFSTAIGLSQSPDYRFENISQEHHHLHAFISSIIEDECGLLWIGSNAGLHSFDGIEFRAYLHDPVDTTSLSSSGITQVIEDLDGNIWASSNYGVNMLDRANGTFEHYAPIDRTSTTKSLNNINILYVDSSNRLWAAGTYCLYLFDRENSKFKTVVIEEDTTQNYLIRGITEDYNGNIWCCSSDGLFKLNTENLSLSEIEPLNFTGEKSVNLYSIDEWKKDHLILGSTNGLLTFDIRKNRMEKIRINPGIDRNTIRGITISSDSLFWLTLHGEGVCVYNPDTGKSIILRHDDGDMNSIHNSDVQCIYEDQFGNMWFGTILGISKITKTNLGFKFYQNVNGQNQRANYIKNLIKDSNGNMWFITADGLYSKEPDDQFGTAVRGFGLDDLSIGGWIIEKSEGEILVPVNDHGLVTVGDKSGKSNDLIVEGTLGNTFVFKILKDQKNPDKLWIGTVNGLAGYDPVKGNIDWYNPQEQIDLLRNDRVVIYDQLGDDIWLYYTYFNSLGHLKTKSGKFELNRPESDKQYILEGTIRDIGISSDSNIWIATSNGLARYDIGKNAYNLYTTHDGLLRNNLFSVILDANEKIWVCGEGIISSFDSKTERFQNFESLDKVKNFWTKSKFIDDEGNIYFGGLNGYYTFHPDSLQFNFNSPKLLLRDFKVQGKTYKLDTAFEYVKSIVLGPKQNDIAFDFVGIQLNDPESVTYRCKLEGYDQEWRDLGKVSLTNYTNLNHGDYLFRVQASTIDGIWHDNELRIKLKIRTPMVKTSWFRSLVVLLLLVLFYLSFRIWSYQQLLRRQKEIAEKSSEYKMKFLAHASHEIRTPMNAILGLSSLTKETELNPEQEKYVDAIEQSSQNLLNIINELLDHARIESGKFSITKSPFKLKSILNQLEVLFYPLALEKNLNFEVSTSNDIPDIIVGDEVRLKQVLTNIIANSIKYTREGSIKIHASAHKQDVNSCEIAFEIKDTGIGIDKTMLNTVFDRFSKQDKSDNIYSSGLGLYITQELVEAQGGSINIDSKVSEGTVVRCILPFGIAANDNGQSIIDLVIPSLSHLKVLIVDDAQFNHLVISNMLKSHVEELIMHSAFDGEEAIAVYKNNDIDLIIMDAKMPIMNGLEATKRIRSLQDTYGPVLILGATAGAMPEQIQKCLDSGMDDVITKPISKRDLMIKISDLTKSKSR